MLQSSDGNCKREGGGRGVDVLVFGPHTLCQVNRHCNVASVHVHVSLGSLEPSTVQDVFARFQLYVLTLGSLSELH